MKIASKKAAARVRGLIRRARKAGRSFANLAEETGVAERTLRYWQNGTRPRADLCEQVTERLEALV